MLGRSSHQPSIWWSKYYFDRLKTVGCWLGLKAFKTIYFHFCKVIKKMKRYIEKIFAKNFVKDYEKKYTWISDAWSMRRLSHRPSVYHIENCQISSSLLTVQAVLIICVYQVVIKQLLIQTHLRTQRAWSCCIVRVSFSS